VLGFLLWLQTPKNRFHALPYDQADLSRSCHPQEGCIISTPWTSRQKTL
jgi:hypothetical protein